MRNALAHAGKSGRRVVSAFIATAFAQDDAGAAKQQWRKVADLLRPKLPKLATLMDEAEHDVLAYMTFPAPHRSHAGQLTHSHPRKAPNPHHPKHLGKMRMIQLVKTLIAGIARAGIENLALSVHCDKMRAFPHHFSDVHGREGRANGGQVACARGQLNGGVTKQCRRRRGAAGRVF